MTLIEDAIEMFQDWAIAYGQAPVGSNTEHDSQDEMHTAREALLSLYRVHVATLPLRGEREIAKLIRGVFGEFVDNGGNADEAWLACSRTVIERGVALPTHDELTTIIEATIKEGFRVGRSQPQIVDEIASDVLAILKAGRE